jgi:hypothetical protein
MHVNAINHLDKNKKPFKLDLNSLL